jgi:hypothetical protein
MFKKVSILLLRIALSFPSSTNAYQLRLGNQLKPNREKVLSEQLRRSHADGMNEQEID